MVMEMVMEMVMVMVMVTVMAMLETGKESSSIPSGTSLRYINSVAYRLFPF